jgi:hypothetical protein
VLVTGTRSDANSTKSACNATWSACTAFGVTSAAC